MSDVYDWIVSHKIEQHSTMWLVYWTLRNNAYYVDSLILILRFYSSLCSITINVGEVYVPQFVLCVRDEGGGA